MFKIFEKKKKKEKYIENNKAIKLAQKFESKNEMLGILPTLYWSENPLCEEQDIATKQY